MIEITGMAHGGDGVGHRDGKAVFVHGGLVGDVLDTEIIEDRGRFERHRLVAVVAPSSSRVEAPCPHFPVCGGCSWQSADYQAQLGWKTETVRSQLSHIGRLEPEVLPTLAVGPEYGYRNRMDFRSSQGRPSLYMEGSHRAVQLDTCLLPVPALRNAFEAIGDLGGITRIVLRAGVDVGLAIVTGKAPREASGWGVSVVRAGEAVHRQVVGGVEFRVTGTAFFQVNTAGAETLVGLVGTAAALEGHEVLLDGFAGGGLFSATVGRRARSVVAVESDRNAASDLRFNTAGSVRVVERPMEALPPDVTCDVAVVDPPRSGLGRDLVENLASRGPHTIVSVSCDAASFARDARLLVEKGYTLDWVQPVDMFPQTPHVEVVGRFARP